MKAVLIHNMPDRPPIHLFALRRHIVLATAQETIRCTSLSKLTEALQHVAPDSRNYIPQLAERPWPERHTQAILLFAISGRWPSILVADEEQSYHVTLAYALPLALDVSWREWAACYSDVLVHGRQVVAVPASNLVAVDPSEDVPRRHRRLLRQHEDTTVREHADYSDFLAHWSTFTQRRYGNSPTSEEQTALGAILAMSRCTVREFTSSGDVIARSVVCVHDPSRTLFDLMATWEPRHASRRPGIYSAVHNLIDAANRKYRYSMCYGQFAYKDEILKGSKRLSLENLISG